MDTTRRLPPLEVWGEYNVFKVLLRSNSQYPYFLYFRVSMTCQISIHYDYQKSFFFFTFISEKLRSLFLYLVLIIAWLRITENDVKCSRYLA